MPATAAAAAAQQPTSLMREIDLVPTLDIPDKLFESESENSDSEAVSHSSYPFYLVTFLSRRTATVKPWVTLWVLFTW